MELTATMLFLIFLAVWAIAVVQYLGYKERTKLQSFEVLERFRRRYMEMNHIMEPILEFDIENPDEMEAAKQKLQELALGRINDFLGLYDEIAIALNSGLINKPVAYYMFGYYADKANADWFWQTYYEGIQGWKNQAKKDWRTFMEFAEDAKDWRAKNLSSVKIKL